MSAQDKIPPSTVSLLDVAVVLAESWRLIFVGMLLVGLVAFAAAYLRPHTYVSRATVALYPMDLVGLQDDAVLDAGIAKADLGTPSEAARYRARMLRGLDVLGTNPIADPASSSASYDALTYVGGHSVVTMSYRDPEKARLLLSGILDAFAKGAGQQRLETLRQPIQAEIGALRAAATAQDGAMKSLKDAYAGQIGAGVADPAGFATAFTTLAQAAARQRARAAALEQILNRLPDHIVLTEPSAGRPEDRDPALLTGIAAALFAGTLLVIFVFARAGLRLAAIDPASKSKVKRIRQALSLRRREASS